MYYYYKKNCLTKTENKSDFWDIEITKEQYFFLVEIAKKGAPDNPPDGYTYYLDINGKWVLKQLEHENPQQEPLEKEKGGKA